MRLLVPAMAACVLAACVAAPPQVVTVASAIHPDLPALALLPDPATHALAWDYPRQMRAAPVTRNSAACQPATPKPSPGCGEQPVDTASNLYLGLSLAEFQAYLRNEQVVNSWIAQAKQQIELVNREREQWRNDNSARP